MTFNHHLRTGVALALAFVGIGCSGESAKPMDKGGAPVLPLGAEPRDLTTDHDATTMRIAVAHYGSTIEEELDGYISLRAFATDAPVAVDLVSESTDAGPGHAWVVHPSSPLTPGWYALVLSADSMRGLGNGHKRADGGTEVRFRVGSQPLLTEVGACASNSNAELPKIRLDFSESVTLPAGNVPVEVMVDGAPASCAVYDEPSAANHALGLECTPPIPAVSAISVSVGQGIVSASSGLDLATSAGALPQTYELPSMAQQESCRYWHETEVPAE